MVNDYWKKRIEAEQLAKMERGATLGEEMDRLYSYHFNELEKEIRAFEQRYADKNGLSLSEAKARVDDFDVKSFEEKAKRYVAEKNFSARANSELALYNLKMKTNRLALLQYQLDLELVALAEDERQLTGRFLNNEFIKAIETQSGLLGRSVLSASQIGTVAHAVLNTPFKDVVWSERIWQRQNALREVVARMTERLLLQGKNPTTMVSQLRKEFDVSASEAKRLAVTEGARVATEGQKQAYIANGYDEYEFIAEPSACPNCAKLDGKIFKVKDMEPGENAAPIHPWCHCSTGAHADDKANQKQIAGDSRKLLTFEENEESIYSFDFIDLSNPENHTLENFEQILSRAKAVIEDYKKQTGIDLVSEFNNKNFRSMSNPYDDNKAKFLKFLYNKIGYDAKPQKLSDTKGYNLFYRGITGSKETGLTAKDFYNRLVDGEYDFSGAMSSMVGRGIYFSIEQRMGQVYAKNGILAEMYFPKNAKVIDDQVLKSFRNAFSNEQLSNPELAAINDLINYDIGPKINVAGDRHFDFWAIFSGHDAVQRDNYEILAVYNRGVLGVKGND
ncbi:minor capsid protein [Streptococcus suis]|uniref:minor capsid protein n=1 Tax=Streptococcus suis TaxID=1307 RepID=UPI00211D347D|nr:minor capsid protein [Streptococcus suis]UUM58641.1 minor capsid protein [Streptococcus suis]